MASIFSTFQSPATGTTLTPSNGADPDGSSNFDAVSIVASGTLATDTAHPAHGAQSCKVATGATAGAVYAQWTSGPFATSALTMWFRVYCYFASNPASGFRALQFLNGSTNLAALTVNPSGKVLMLDSGLVIQTTSTASIPLNAVFRLEGKVFSSATVGQLEVKLFTTPDSTTAAETDTSAASQNTLGSAINGCRFGTNASTANLGPAWFSDLAFSDVGYLGPSNRAYGTSKQLGALAAVGRAANF